MLKSVQICEAACQFSMGRVHEIPAKVSYCIGVGMFVHGVSHCSSIRLRRPQHDRIDFPDPDSTSDHRRRLRHVPQKEPGSGLRAALAARSRGNGCLGSLDFARP
jgi:hypothetical protein